SIHLCGLHAGGFRDDGCSYPQQAHRLVGRRRTAAATALDRRAYFVLGLERPQAKLLDLKTYGPVLSAAAAKGDAATQKIRVMSPDNLKDMLILNEQEADKYSRTYEEAWNQMMLG